MVASAEGEAWGRTRCATATPSGLLPAAGALATVELSVSEAPSSMRRTSGLTDEMAACCADGSRAGADGADDGWAGWGWATGCCTAGFGLLRRDTGEVRLEFACWI